MSAQIVIAYTEMTGLKPTGRMVMRDLNWFPEYIAVEQPKAAMWLRKGTDADLAKAREHMIAEHRDKVRVAVYAIPTECKDPLGEAKKRVMQEPTR